MCACKERKNRNRGLRQHSLKSSHLKSGQGRITHRIYRIYHPLKGSRRASAAWRYPASQSSPVLHGLWLSPSSPTGYCPDLKPLFFLSPKAPFVCTSIALVSQEDRASHDCSHSSARRRNHFPSTWGEHHKCPHGWYTSGRCPAGNRISAAELIASLLSLLNYREAPD